MKNTFLPGSNNQLKFLLDNIDVTGNKILVVGSASENIAVELAEKSGVPVTIIVEDLNSFMNSNMILEEAANVEVKMMDFDATDFGANTFDLIYAQASVSLDKRNKIIKEFKRILNPGGVFCTGEIVTVGKNIPAFVNDIMISSAMEPLNSDEFQNYYEQRGFEILNLEDLTSTLGVFYSGSLVKLSDAIKDFSERESSYYKKLVNKIKHESEAYLKHGADKYIGFKVILMRKDK